MPKYKVAVCRISYGHTEVEVEAPTLKEAANKAITAACDVSFSERKAEYSIYSMTEIT